VSVEKAIMRDKRGRVALGTVKGRRLKVRLDLNEYIWPIFPRWYVSVSADYGVGFDSKYFFRRKSAEAHFERLLKEYGLSEEREG